MDLRTAAHRHRAALAVAVAVLLSAAGIWSSVAWGQSLDAEAAGMAPEVAGAIKGGGLVATATAIGAGLVTIARRLGLSGRIRFGSEPEPAPAPAPAPPPRTVLNDPETSDICAPMASDVRPRLKALEEAVEGLRRDIAANTQTARYNSNTGTRIEARIQAVDDTANQILLLLADKGGR